MFSSTFNPRDPRSTTHCTQIQTSLVSITQCEQQPSNVCSDSESRATGSDSEPYSNPIGDEVGDSSEEETESIQQSQDQKSDPDTTVRAKPKAQTRRTHRHRDFSLLRLLRSCSCTDVACKNPECRKCGRAEMCACLTCCEVCPQRCCTYREFTRSICYHVLFVTLLIAVIVQVFAVWLMPASLSPLSSQHEIRRQSPDSTPSLKNSSVYDLGGVLDMLSFDSRVSHEFAETFFLYPCDATPLFTDTVSSSSTSSTKDNCLLKGGEAFPRPTGATDADFVAESMVVRVAFSRGGRHVRLDWPQPDAVWKRSAHNTERRGDVGVGANEDAVMQLPVAVRSWQIYADDRVIRCVTTVVPRWPDWAVDAWPLPAMQRHAEISSRQPVSDAPGAGVTVFAELLGDADVDVVLGRTRDHIERRWGATTVLYNYQRVGETQWGGMRVVEHRASVFNNFEMVLHSLVTGDGDGDGEVGASSSIWDKLVHVYVRGVGHLVSTALASGRGDAFEHGALFQASETPSELRQRKALATQLRTPQPEKSYETVQSTEYPADTQHTDQEASVIVGNGWDPDTLAAGLASEPAYRFWCGARHGGFFDHCVDASANMAPQVRTDTHTTSCGQTDGDDPCFAPDVCTSPRWQAATTTNVCDVASQPVFPAVFGDVFGSGFQSCEPYDLPDASCRIYAACRVVNDARRASHAPSSYFAATDWALRFAPFAWEWCACTHSHAARLDSMSTALSCMEMQGDVTSVSGSGQCASHPHNAGSNATMRNSMQNIAKRRPCFQYSRPYSLKRPSWYNGYNTQTVYVDPVTLSVGVPLPRSAEFDGCQMRGHLECDGRFDSELFQFQRDTFYADYTIWWQKMFEER